MPISARNGILWATVLYWLTLAQVGTGTSVTISGTQSTCPARSINYITQTLPQQCLTSSWASKSTTQTLSTNTTASQIDVSKGVLTGKAPHTGIDDASVTLTTYAESPTAEAISSSSTGGQEAAQTATSSEKPERAEPSEESSPENDLDSPLDNSKFLSFEEWKHQNLAKAGQSAESLGKRQEGEISEQRRRPASINNALEAFGEDSEIDIDFSGFVNAGGMNEALPIQSALPVGSTAGETGTPKEHAEDLSNTHKRNKEAGKTCKERSNYASFDCAATALKTNPECKSATSVLVESKDSYMLNVCSVKNKFLIVELCDHILVDTIVLANFEYFSSMFRTFRVSVSDKYPVKMDRWKELGVFEARNSRAIQAFLIENPLIWARYLRIEFLTHFGAEYYCPVSLLRVHGTTMMEEFNHEVKGSRSEDDPEDEAEGASNEASIKPSETVFADVPSPVADIVTEQIADMASPIVLSTAASAEKETNILPSTVASVDNEDLVSVAKGSSPYRSISKRLEDILFYKNDCVDPVSDMGESTKKDIASKISPTNSDEPEKPDKLNDKSDTQNENGMASEQIQKSSLDASAVLDPPSSTSKSIHPSIGQNRTGASTNVFNSSMMNATTTSINASMISVATDSATTSMRDLAISSGASSAMQSPRANSTSITKSSTRESSAAVSSSTPSPPSTATGSSTSVKAPSSSTQPHAANPSTQESFFKSVHKRLQQLEANSTLSLQYIEQQSRILRDAFSSVEKRQLSKTTSFLETLNTTVLTELRDFRMQYDQIWQSTVLELSSQREQSAQQVSVLSTRMTFLADEIVFQKRIAMVQFMLILLCLGLIVFSRTDRTSTYLELPPLVHNAIKRSSANLARYTHYETPPTSPSSSRPPSEGLTSKYNLFQRKSHRRTPSDESDANCGIQSPVIAYSPPSPVSQISRDDRDPSPSGPSADEFDNLSFN